MAPACSTRSPSPQWLTSASASSGKTAYALMTASGAPSKNTLCPSGRRPCGQSARALWPWMYIWLAYRLHALSRATPVTWTALHGQFGAGFKAIRQLKPTFREALALALAVYPEAKVEEDAAGMVLHPSPPAVPRADAKRLGV